MLEKAVQLQPGFAKAHLNLGDAYRGLKDYERAQAEYQKALQLFPNYADAVFNLGILYLDADKMPNMELRQAEHRHPVPAELQADDGRNSARRPIPPIPTSWRRRRRSRRSRSGSSA